jgi:hypothetical protein
MFEQSTLGSTGTVEGSKKATKPPLLQENRGSGALEDWKMYSYARAARRFVVCSDRTTLMRHQLRLTIIFPISC